MRNGSRRTQRAVLPVPDANGLIVRGRDDPGKLVMEEDSADIVEMAIEGEEAATSLERPDLDLVVVTTGNEERLCLVEVDTSYRTVVFFEAVNQSAHAVVP
jgi:hypothetical protein